MQVKLQNYISADLIFTDLPKLPKDGFLTIFINRICRQCPDLPVDAINKAVFEREAYESTAIGGGIAFPHCRLDELDRIVVAVGVCRDGIDYNAPDNKPVHLIISILGPNSRSEEYLYLLGQIARVMSDRKRRERIITSPDAMAIYQELESII